MKTIQLIFCLAILLGSCKKDKEPISVTSEVSESFTSLDDFYFKKGPRSQSFTMDATAGGTFISSQGTTVIIPAEAFENSTGSLVTGPVTIEFKDLYKKSDMLMANMPTVDITGKPLKSGGEFYIKVMSNAEALQIRSSKNILVKMPFQAEGPDPGMMPFIGIDTAQQLLWMAQQNDSLGVDLNGYVYTLYSLGSSVDSGTWGNSDNPNFFFNYTQTHLTIHTDDSTNYRTDVL